MVRPDDATTASALEGVPGFGRALRARCRRAQALVGRPSRLPNRAELAMRSATALQRPPASGSWVGDLGERAITRRPVVHLRTGPASVNTMIRSSFARARRAGRRRRRAAAREADPVGDHGVGERLVALPHGPSGRREVVEHVGQLRCVGAPGSLSQRTPRPPRTGSARWGSREQGAAAPGCGPGRRTSCRRRVAGRAPAHCHMRAPGGALLGFTMAFNCAPHLAFISGGGGGVRGCSRRAGTEPALRVRDGRLPTGRPSRACRREWAWRRRRQRRHRAQRRKRYGTQYRRVVRLDADRFRERHAVFLRGRLPSPRRSRGARTATAVAGFGNRRAKESRAAGMIISASTEAAPADSPKIVTCRGSPPNA